GQGVPSTERLVAVETSPRKWLSWSYELTVYVWLEPAVIVAGPGASVMWSGPAATNETVAVSESASASDASRAPKTAFSTTVSTTLKLTRPRLSEGPLGADVTALPPPVSDALLPETGLP